MKGYNPTTYLLGLPQITSISELANLINLTEQTLYHLSYRTSKFYKKVTIKKKDGSPRIIHCPSPKLKAIQAWILRYILGRLPIHECATAFRKHGKLIDNANRHKNYLFHLCLDIENFFPSIKSKYVFNLFRALGYNNHIASVLTNYCTLNNGLPQGGVTSPILSNIINIRLDRRIAGYASKKNLVYTRYADDITLSSNSPAKLMKAKTIIELILMDEGYKLNYKKTRLLRPGSKRKITGIIIPEKGDIGVGKKVRRVLRAKIHQIETGYLSNHEYRFKKAHLDGWFAYLKTTETPERIKVLADLWNRKRYEKQRLETKHEIASSLLDEQVHP